MSGFGERFRSAGYTVPKPLIPVNGRPIIAHVLDIFPGEQNIWFICNREHLQNSEYRMSEILYEICPQGHICSIEPHSFGPVYAVSQIFEQLDPHLPTIVNYCDFTCRWDWKGFQSFVEKTQCAGAVVCYTGFHPHMLGNSHYAYVKTNGTNRILSIQEKQSYTDTPMQEYASSGTYYFRSGHLMQKTFEETLERPDLQLNGEYYVSLSYRPLLEKGEDVQVFTLEKFCQWGTPQDLKEWKYYKHSQYLECLPQRRPEIKGVLLIPMAGLGSRFTHAGYTIPKPFLQVRSQPMFLSAWEDLPYCSKNVFVFRADMPGSEGLSEFVRKVPGVKLLGLHEKTEGQACTCLLGLDDIGDDESLTIGACDNGLRYDADCFEALWREDVDIIVWTIRGYPGAIKNPHMYGWADVDSRGYIQRVFVKKPLMCLNYDPILTGAFTFRRTGDFRQSVRKMIKREGRVNNEFYVDECINDAIGLGLNVRIFDVDAYLCWGTPEDLMTYEYWLA